MIDGIIGFFVLLLNAGSLDQREQVPPPSVRIMTVEQRMIVRVPVRVRSMPTVGWEEHKGPKCMPARAIAGAFLAGPGNIDFVLRNKQRVRARLDNDCDGLDYYGGFYLQPEDGEVCAGRDTIRNRAGNVCRIDKFRMLSPTFAKAD